MATLKATTVNEKLTCNAGLSSTKTTKIWTTIATGLNSGQALDFDIYPNALNYRYLKVAVNTTALSGIIAVTHPLQFIIDMSLVDSISSIGYASLVHGAGMFSTSTSEYIIPQLSFSTSNNTLGLFLSQHGTFNIEAIYGTNDV